METNKEAMRLPDPVLVRIFRAGRISDVIKVDMDDERNLTVIMRGEPAPVRFSNLTDVGWVLEGTCQGL